MMAETLLLLFDQFSDVVHREECESSASDSDDFDIALRARTQKNDSKVR